jgi:hypothetical protein
MSSAQKIGKRCRQNPWRQHFFGAAKVLAASWRQLCKKAENPATMRVCGVSFLASTLAPTWRDHAAKPPHPYRVAATGEIWAGGMSGLWITRSGKGAQSITLL